MSKNDSTSKQKHVWVIIINYNGRQFLTACLAALYQQTYSSFTILIVDNASTDDSLEQVSTQYPAFHILRESVNWGFAEGNNRGIRYALIQGAEVIVLLNYDTEVHADWLKEGLATLARHPETGIVQSKILLYDLTADRRTDRINTSGNQLHFLGFGYCGDYDTLDQGQFDDDAEIQYGSGAALFIRRAVFDKIGLFVPWFFMYHEELDLCWRTRLAGYQIRRSGRSIVWHKYTFGRNTGKFYYMERNRWATLIRNYHISTLIWLLPLGMITELGLIIDALRHGWFLKKIAAYGSFIQKLPIILVDRPHIQMLRQRTDHQILNFMTSDINFSGYQVGFMNNLFNRFSRSYLHFLRKVVR